MGAALPILGELGAADLRALARQEKNGRTAVRMLALAHALDGVGRAEAARLAGMDRQALRDTVVRYDAEGIAGLYDRVAPGRLPWLGGAELRELKQAILGGLISNGTVMWNGPCRRCARL